MRDLNKRFYRRFNRNISFKINLRGNKILYFNKDIDKSISELLNRPLTTEKKL